MLNITNLTLSNVTTLLENIDFELLKQQAEERLRDLNPNTTVVYSYLLWCLWRLVWSLFVPSTVFVTLCSVVAYVATMKHETQWKFAALIAWGVISARNGRGKWRYHILVSRLIVDVYALVQFGFLHRGLLAYTLGVACGFYILPYAKVVDRLFRWSFWIGIILAMVALAMLGGLGATVVKDEL